MFYSRFFMRIVYLEDRTNMLSRQFVLMHKSSIAIVLFLVLFSLFHYFKPGFAYGPDGEFRPFGIGYRNKTVLPIWTMAITLAILSYLFVMYISR
jgi:hypothetical protein